MSITAFPNELLTLIFELLSENISTLKVCSLVSTHWHAIATTFLFSSLNLLCSADNAIESVLPRSKSTRHAGLAFGILPVYRRRWSVEEPNAHCVCAVCKDRAVQQFHSCGASSSPHVSGNVTRLTLMFCSTNTSGGTDPFSNGPHSLQLYPDSVILSLLHLVDELSFIHLRFLTFDCAPQVLYFLQIEPFSGILSSAASSLEEITFNGGLASIQSYDIKRMLKRHAFSCSRYPHLRRLVFRGLAGLGSTLPSLNVALELMRTHSALDGIPYMSVGVSYSLNRNPLVDPDGFLKFQLPNWCCFSGPYRNAHQSNNECRSLVELMSLGTGFIDWSLPTIEIVLRLLQSETLGSFAQALEVKVCSIDMNDSTGVKLRKSFAQTFPRISTLNLCFSTIGDMRLFLLDRRGGVNLPQNRTTDIIQHLSLLSELRSLRFTLTKRAAVIFALEQSDKIIEQLASAMDILFLDFYLLRRDREFYDISKPGLEGLETVLQVYIPPTSRERDIPISLVGKIREQQQALASTSRGTKSVDNSDLWLVRIKQELESIFRRTNAVDPGFLTVRVASA